MAEETHIPNPRIKERAKTGVILTEKEQIGFNGKIAVFLTHAFGSMWMFYALAVWVFVWMLFATLGIGLFKNDPYPYTFLLFLGNLVQLFALPILAVGQQVLSSASDKQAEQTYKDAEAILKLQDEIHRLVKINNRLTEDIHTIIEKNK